MDEHSGFNNALLETGPMVDEMVMLVRDDFCSIGISPKAARLERIVEALELKATQYKEAIETGEGDRAQSILHRLLKQVTKYYRVRR